MLNGMTGASDEEEDEEEAGSDDENEEEEEDSDEDEEEDEVLEEGDSGLVPYEAIEDADDEDIVPIEKTTTNDKVRHDSLPEGMSSQF